MSKTIDLAEANKWDEEETLNNIKYLEDRGRYAEAAPLREQAGLGPAPEAAEVEDRLLHLDQDRQVTSGTGVNDTPEHDPETDGLKQTRAISGEPGPHGANADQMIPDDDEHNTKNRPDTSDRETKARSSNVGSRSEGTKAKKKGSKKDE